MAFKRFAYTTIIPLLFLVACKGEPKQLETTEQNNMVQKDTVQEQVAEVQKEEEPFLLSEDNAIDFFFTYNKTLKDDTVKITTTLGSFSVQLFNNVPYHKANFIYLTSKGKPGSYHLDGEYTPFGKVIEGMDVVDKINAQPVGKGDWPSQNIYILKAEVVN